ncbi:MAG: hypothetical protein ABIQ93_11950, partial [Saprospiraceae bacterium]
LQLSAYYRAQQKAHPKLKLSKVGNLLAGLNYAGKADLYEVPFIRRPLIFFKKPLENSLVRFYVLLISGFIVWQIGNGPAAAPATVTLGKEKRPAADLKTAISSWMKARNMSNDTSEYPVYIVSGQGGGSRAGYWMSHTLLGLDSLSQGQFRKHCFALSTISGSSPGAAVSLAYWVDTLPDKPGWQYFPQAVYENNFITCGVAGNFFGDFLRKFGFPRIKNRNQRLQEEEAWCVQRALHPDHSRVSLADAFGYRPIGMDSMQTLYQGFDRLYYPDDTLRTDLPYFFANTCHVQTGKRGVASVFRKGRDQDLFLLDAIPITELMDTTITLGGAANISELFPFVSAAGGIDYQHPKPKVDPQAPDDWAPETALFVDGGYYENYGLTTALELSRMFKVVKQENPKAFSRFKIHIICVVNSDAHIGESDLPHQTVSHSVNQFQAPVTALLNTPFSGHASQLRWQMKYVFHPDSLFDYSEIVLPNSVNVPLSRILTQANIKKMDDAWEKDVTVNKISISLHKK